MLEIAFQDNYQSIQTRITYQDQRMKARERVSRPIREQRIGCKNDMVQNKESLQRG
jgi:hypothetical protein